MSLLLFNWIEHDLQLPLPRDRFESHFRSGFRLGEVALKVGMLLHESDSADASPFEDSEDHLATKRNFRRLKALLSQNGLDLKQNQLSSIVKCERGAAASLLLRLLDWKANSQSSNRTTRTEVTTTTSSLSMPLSRYRNASQRLPPRDLLFNKSDVLSTVRDGYREVERQMRALKEPYLDRRCQQEANGFDGLEALRSAHQCMLSSLRDSQLSKDREAKEYQKTWTMKGIRSWQETRKRMTRQEAADLRVELSVLERRKDRVESNRRENAKDMTKSIADYELNFRQLGINSSDIKDREVTLKVQPPNEEKPYDQFKRLSAFVSTVSFERPMKLYQSGIRRRRQQLVLDSREKEVRNRRQLVAQKRTQEQIEEEKREEELLLRVQSAYQKEVEDSLRYRQRQSEKERDLEESHACSAENAQHRQSEADVLMKQFTELAAQERDERSAQISQIIMNDQLEQENRKRLKHEDAIRFIRFIPHACADIAMLVSDYKQNNRPKVPPLVWREWKEQLVKGKPFFGSSYSGDPMHHRNWEYELYSQYDYANFTRESELDTFLLPIPGRVKLPMIEESPLVWKKLLSPWPTKPPFPHPPVSLGLVVWGAPLAGKSICLEELSHRLYMDYYSVEMVLEELVALSSSPEQPPILRSRFISEEYRVSMDALQKSYTKLSPVKTGGASKKPGNPLEVLEKLRKDASLVRVLAAMVNQLKNEEGSTGWILEWNLSMDLWLSFSYLTASPSFVEALGKGAETEDLFLKKMKGKKFDFPPPVPAAPITAESTRNEIGSSVWNDSFHSFGILCFGQEFVESPETLALAASIAINPQTGSVVSPAPVTPTNAAPSNPKELKKTPEPIAAAFPTGIPNVPYPLSSRKAEFESMRSGPLGQAYFQIYPCSFSYPDKTSSDRVLSDLLTVYLRAGWEGKQPEPEFDLSTIDGRVESAVYWYQRQAWESEEAVPEKSTDDNQSQYGVEPYIQELMINYERIEMETEDEMKDSLLKLYQADQQRAEEISKASKEILESLRGPLGGTKHADTEAQCDSLWMDAYHRIEETKRLVSDQKCVWVNEVAEKYLTEYSSLLDHEVQYWAQWIRLYSVLQFNQHKSFSLDSLMLLLPDFQSKMDSLQQQLSPSPTSEHATNSLNLLYQDLYQLLQELKEEERQKKIEKYERQQRERCEQLQLDAEFKLSLQMEEEYRKEEKEKVINPPPAVPASNERKSSSNRSKDKPKGKTPPQTGNPTEPTPVAPSAVSEPSSIPEAVQDASDDDHNAPEQGPQDASMIEISTELLEMYYSGMESVVRLSQHADHQMDKLLESGRWIQSKANLWIESRIQMESQRIDHIRSLPTGSPLPPYDFTDTGTRQGLKSVIQSLIPEADATLKWCKVWGLRSLTQWDLQFFFHEGVKAGILSPDWFSLLDESSFLRMGKSLNRQGGSDEVSFSLRDIVLDLLETKHGIPEIKYILKLYTSLSCKDRQGDGTVFVKDLSKVIHSFRSFYSHIRKEFLWFSATDAQVSDFWRLLAFVFAGSDSGSGSTASVNYLDFLFHLCCRETQSCPPQRHTGILTHFLSFIVPGCYAAVMVASKQFNIAPGCIHYSGLREIILREPGNRPEHWIDSIWDDMHVVHPIYCLTSAHQSSDAIVPFFALCQSRNFQILVESGFYRFTACLQL